MLELRKLVVGFPVRGVFGAPTFAMLRNPVVCLPTFPKLSKLVFPSKLRKLVVGVPVLSVFSTASDIALSVPASWCLNFRSLPK
jgi:hypothetical protein